MSRLADPLFWSTAVLSAAVVALLAALGRVRAAFRRSVDHTSSELASTAKELLANVSAVTETSAQAVASVRETTETMTHLTHGAMTAVVTAESVIGLAAESERAAADAVAAAEARGAELLQLADDVRAMAQRVERLNARMRDLFEAASVVGFVAERSQRLAACAGGEGAGDAARPEDVPEELRRHAEDARRAAQQVKAVLAEVSAAMTAAMSAAEVGSRHAEAGAELVRSTGETIRSLAAALRESAGAARHIARVAQAQEARFDEVLRAMNSIYLATEKTLASTEQVAREARSLDGFAASLRRAAAGGAEQESDRPYVRPPEPLARPATPGEDGGPSGTGHE